MRIIKSVWSWLVFSAIVVFAMMSPLIGTMSGAFAIQECAEVGTILSQNEKEFILYSFMLGFPALAFCLFSANLLVDRARRGSQHGS